MPIGSQSHGLKLRAKTTGALPWYHLLSLPDESDGVESLMRWKRNSEMSSPKTQPAYDKEQRKPVADWLKAPRHSIANVENDYIGLYCAQMNCGLIADCFVDLLY